MLPFVHGAIMFGFAVAGLFFFKFWRRTKDKLLLFFACAFLLMALNRIALLLTGSDSELRTYVYYVRMTAFCLIIWAIVEKNMPAKKTLDSPEKEEQTRTP